MVNVPILPINISNIIMPFPKSDKSGVIPKLNSTVEKADTTSNNKGIISLLGSAYESNENPIPITKIDKKMIA